MSLNFQLSSLLHASWFGATFRCKPGRSVCKKQGASYYAACACEGVIENDDKCASYLNRADLRHHRELAQGNIIASAPTGSVISSTEPGT